MAVVKVTVMRNAREKLKMYDYCPYKNRLELQRNVPSELARGTGTYNKISNIKNKLMQLQRKRFILIKRAVREMHSWQIKGSRWWNATLRSHLIDLLKSQAQM